MEININGWWHPVRIHLNVPINNINQAEYVVDFLKKMKQYKQAEILRKHIKEQGEMKFLKSDAYNKSSWLPENIDDIDKEDENYVMEDIDET